MLHFFFGFKGRVRRTHYFLGTVVTGMLVGLFGAQWMHVNHIHYLMGWDYGDYDFDDFVLPPTYWLLGPIVGFASAWVHLALAAKRWHDMGATGWLALLSLVPGVNVIVFLVLCLAPPSPAADLYGADPRARLAMA
jgi:uncharacterized membrane protein YhaH (DUF805 family)